MNNRKFAPRINPARGRSTKAQFSRLAFAAGDCVFLAAVSMVAIAIMRMAHHWEGPFLLVSITGMVLAMAAQMLMSFLVSPILGSIESMTPAMVIAMVSPMTLDAMHLLGCELAWWDTLALGLVLGVGMFLFVAAYDAACKRSFQHRFKPG